VATHNEEHAGRTGGQTRAVDAYDAQHGRYDGMPQAVAPLGQPGALPSATNMPPAPAVYDDRVQGVDDEALVGTDVMPRASDPIPYMKR
jgi:hypothetical protein